jgi:hypothetical protein
VFIKGDKKKIENYMPIANLCSTSKIFKKLILQQITESEEPNKIDITNKSYLGLEKVKVQILQAYLYSQ